MDQLSGVKEHMEVIGADRVHVGTVEKVENGRTELTRNDSGTGHHHDQHHYIAGTLVAEVEGNKASTPMAI